MLQNALPDEVVLRCGWQRDRDAKAQEGFQRVVKFYDSSGHGKEPTPHTKAWLTFEENLGSIMHMLTLGYREAAALKA
jgi:hypothetical protein